MRGRVQTLGPRERAILVDAALSFFGQREAGPHDIPIDGVALRPGVYVARVWVNGQHLGHRPYGYVSFQYEITDHVRFGAENVIAVRADTSKQPASRWYTGAGIYRHVWLTVTEPVHIDQWGVFVTTPEVSAGQATVQVLARIVNRSASASEMTVTISEPGPSSARKPRPRRSGMPIVLR